MQNRTRVGSIVSLLTGLLFSFIGFVNLCWGNDPFFGAFILFLSLLYYPPVQHLIQKKTGYTIPNIAKIGIALFIIWASVGVGELFDKIDLMLQRLGS